MIGVSGHKIISLASCGDHALPEDQACKACDCDWIKMLRLIGWYISSWYVCLHPSGWLHLSAYVDFLTYPLLTCYRQSQVS
jgi:hypothetical protein